ncbi:WD-repeat protein, putative [Eimeria necatrix]|uniref:WD-repeat protein, putative n=1 Tax=Eimeria necatrix TaxID=51315 RepID=U6N3L5_9EIME|nr:WD-repeat protein, putative [Eimeria necatrix]CDJ69904.1 WD-repeat protein, putative [Eimeria necatrix]
MNGPAAESSVTRSALPAMMRGPPSSRPVSGEFSSMWRGFDTREVLRLILQTLDEMGYRDIVASLEKASGVELLQPDMRMLRRSILEGNWIEAGRALLRLPLEPPTRQGCWFLLMQHKFLEMVVDPCSTLDARLKCLRKDLSASAFDAATVERVHECSALLMYQGSDLLAHVLQISSLSRHQLFSRITCLLPASVAMQPSMLATILDHARRFQILTCPLHVESSSFAPKSIIEPHRCKIPLLPQYCVGCLHAHRKEVWTIAVSPKHTNSTEALVASGSADRSVCVWLLTTETSTGTKISPGEQSSGERESTSQLGAKWLASWLEGDTDLLMRLEQTQARPILESGNIIGTCRLLWRVQRLASATAFLDWDSTGKLLAAGGEAAFIEAWEEGRRIGDYCPHGGSIVALQWVPGSRRLISMATDRTMTLVSLEESSLTPTHVVEYEWILPGRPQEGFLLPRGNSVMIFFADRQIKLFDLVTKEETFWASEKDLVIAACPSKICNQILISAATTPPVLRLWDLDERKIVQKYKGHKVGRLAIRPAFGGPREELVISGSEDAQIYIWHRVWGCMLQQLRGHAAAVNQVAWVNFCNPVCLLSAGDDGVLLLWSLPTTSNEERVEPSSSPETATLSPPDQNTPDASSDQ